MDQRALILMVEDSENDALLIGRTLVQAGLANPVRVAVDAEKAISYLKGEGPYSIREKFPLPGLVLLDLKLPGKDGFEVLKWIRSQTDLNSLRVVVLTSSTEIRDANRAYQLGANSFLVKPLELNNVDSILAAFNGHSPGSSSKPTRLTP